MQLLNGSFSMTSLIVAYLFPCKWINGQLFVALFHKINNCNTIAIRRAQQNEKNEIFLVFIAHMDLEKSNNY